MLRSGQARIPAPAALAAQRSACHPGIDRPALRTQEGVFNSSGLQLIRYSTEARLNEIMQICRDHGVQINNPHVYIVKDGKQHLAKLDAHLRENRARGH